jgi:hypothetical protein
MTISQSSQFRSGLLKYAKVSMKFKPGAKIPRLKSSLLPELWGIPPRFPEHRLASADQEKGRGAGQGAGAAAFIIRVSFSSRRELFKVTRNTIDKLLYISAVGRESKAHPAFLHHFISDAERHHLPPLHGYNYRFGRNDGSLNKANPQPSSRMTCSQQRRSHMPRSPFFRRRAESLSPLEIWAANRALISCYRVQKSASPEGSVPMPCR